MYLYDQATGHLTNVQDPAFLALCYSGHEEGRNNPALQSHPELGPIPVGAFTIGPVFNSPTHGPVSMDLVPYPDTNTFGRSGFMLHPDSIEHPGEASFGCICTLAQQPNGKTGRQIREEIAAGQDRALQVIVSGN